MDEPRSDEGRVGPLGPPGSGRGPIASGLPGPADNRTRHLERLRAVHQQRLLVLHRADVWQAEVPTRGRRPPGGPSSRGPRRSKLPARRAGGLLQLPGDRLGVVRDAADPRGTEANNLNIDAEGCLAAIRMVNAVGRERGENGMPRLLPGLNFVVGLGGETKKTFDLNLAFLKRLLGEDLWVRRINIRQVRPVRREFEPTGLYREFRKFKEAVRTLIDHE